MSVDSRVAPRQKTGTFPKVLSHAYVDTLLEKDAITATSRHSATSWIRDLLGALGSGHRQRSDDWQCPAHEDPSPSLGVAAGDDGSALLRCLGGCATGDVLAVLGLGAMHLHRPPATPAQVWARMLAPRPVFPPLKSGRGGGGSGFRFDAEHRYGDRFRMVRYRNPATGAKTLEWERHSNGCWVPGLGGTPLSELPLYRAREARMAVGADETLVLVESESSVDALCSAGVYATTWAGGAATPQLHRLTVLCHARRLVLCPDNDPPGIACAELILGVLPDAALRMPPAGMDARDLLALEGPGVFQ